MDPRALHKQDGDQRFVWRKGSKLCLYGLQQLKRDAAILNLIRSHAILHQATRERDDQGRIVATLDDYAVVRDLVADLVAEGVEATVPETIRETVAAVEQALELEQEQEYRPNLKPKKVFDMAFNVNKLKNSRFLKKEDCDRDGGGNGGNGDGLLVTIAAIKEENVALDSEKPDMKWVLHFEEDVKPMVLNSTNGEAIAKIAGGDTEEAWIGVKIVLYHDPNLSFARKRTGGIRVRAPKVPEQATKTGQTSVNDAHSDIPF